MSEFPPHASQSKTDGAASPSATATNDISETNWHSRSVEEVAADVQADVEHGLSPEAAENRLREYGENTLAKVASATWLQVLARQFSDVLVFILLIAAAISFVVGERVDTVVILAIVVLNAALGFAQEWKAERAIEALQDMLAPHCRVLRAGQERDLEARELVPGDIVLLETGNRIPTDLRISVAHNLKVDESTLTGESESVFKSAVPVARDAPLAERHSMAWMGTAVTNGHGRGIVVATGMKTEFGRIAQLTQSIDHDATPLQVKLGHLGSQLGIAAVVVSILVGVTGFLLGEDLKEMFFTAVSLAVAVVPEGLPAVVTITLALGIRTMVERKALLRRLQAAEALGSATVICTDKTGTLTQNEMTVQAVWLSQGLLEVTNVGYRPEGEILRDGVSVSLAEMPSLQRLLETAVVCNDARIEETNGQWREVGEPTEAALITLAGKSGWKLNRKVCRVAEFSFNSDRKRMTVVEEHDGRKIAHVKGAPEVIVARCAAIAHAEGDRLLSEDDQEAIHEAYSDLARDGLRTLALASRAIGSNSTLDEDTVEKDLTLLGIVGIIDPPRPEVPDAIRKAERAGIRVIMITGDAAPTAEAIAKKIGLNGGQALTGRDLDDMDDARLRTVLDGDPIVARAVPEHKIRLVKLLQDQGNIVGMTGDGVNDAPALRKADIGIAMGLRGTDVAKGAADMVLTDDNFSSIINAVEEGRRQYDNIQKFVRYLLSSNVGEVVAIFANILLRGPMILFPVQILWTNLITDGVTAVTLGLEKAEPGVMKRPPYDPKRPILDWTGTLVILALGTYIGLATLGMFHYYLATCPHLTAGDRRKLAQTVAFTTLIVAEKMNVFNFRGLKSPLMRIGFWSNPWLLWAAAGMIGLQALAVYVPFLQTALRTVPLSFQDWGLIFLVSFPVLLVPECVKWWRDREPQATT